MLEDENGLRAGDDLNEIFAEDEVESTYRNADRVARNVLLLLAPLLRADPHFGETAEEGEKLVANLVRVYELAGALYAGHSVDQGEVHGARFVMTCLEARGEAGTHVLAGVRYALSALSIAQASVVFDEMWAYPGPEAWTLAVRAYEELQALADVDNSEQDFWVRPDEAVVSLALAHRISDDIRAAGGGETMSNN